MTTTPQGIDPAPRRAGFARLPLRGHPRGALQRYSKKRLAQALEEFKLGLEGEAQVPLPNRRRKPSPRCIRWTTKVLSDRLRREQPDLPFYPIWRDAEEQAARRGPALSYLLYSPHQRESLAEQGWTPHQIETSALLEVMKALLAEDELGARACAASMRA